MGTIHTLQEFLEMVRRRAALISVVGVVAAIGSVFFALSLPHQYVSSEVIQIEQPRIADELAPSTVAGSSARRLQLIEQQLMSRDSILAVIAKHDVYAHLPALSDSEKVGLFRSSVAIEGVAAVREGGVDDGTVAALTITATMGSPEKAQAVAHELAQQTIVLSAQERRAKSKATLEFFQSEEAALADAVAQLEAEIIWFRTENDVASGGRLEFVRSEMSAINEAILSVERSQINVRRELENIQTDGARPATLRRVGELKRQSRALEDQIAYLTQKGGILQQSIQSAPETATRIDLYETQLRHYQNQLEEVANQRTSAEIAYRLEINSRAERLIVLERAPLPEHPARPNRKKIAALGSMAGLFAALTLAFLLDLRNPVIRSAAQLQRELGIVPVVSIPAHRPARVGSLGRLRGLLPPRTARHS